MTPLVDLIEAAMKLGYHVEGVSDRHITLVYVEAGHVTVIDVSSTALTPELLAKLVKAVQP